MNSKRHWITAWCKSQRGLGLVSQLFHTHQEIQIEVPATTQLRFRFSTWYETESVVLHDVTCESEYGTQVVTFHGNNAITIAPQSTIQSDIVSISEEIKNCTLRFTIETNQPVSSAVQLSSYDPVYAKHDLVYVFHGVDVLTDQIRSNVSVIGDSISEQGHWTTPITHWLHQYGIGFLHHGISGNRLCKELSQVMIDPAHTYMFEGTTIDKNQDVLGSHIGISLKNQCFGIAGTKRFSTQICGIDQGVGLMLFALGTNDLYQPGTFCSPMSELVELEEFMSAYRQLFQQAKAYGMKTIALCIPPFKGADSWNEEKEQLRQDINIALQKEPLLDGVIAFDAVLCNTNGELKKEVFGEDCLHPNEAGGALMAACIQKELEVWLGYLDASLH